MGKAPSKRYHLLELAYFKKINNAKPINEQVQEVTYIWKDFAKLCKVSIKSKNRIQK